ncbi:imelysin family protein [Cyclobacterium jeungdonense]|uniref:Imelysin family protein n=1 Tax=Cyclobacterium jeungdonense TaxID=708087 RepID=A0ABT8C7L6_9BACT|nr:imelysin family protein [Cyclobacterium jeungdonense]MDN3688505.1 imelysin family protein [Cyclobacterium jeungdonense]
MNRRLYPTAVILAILVGVISCEESDAPIQDSFDRSEMLENMAQNLIIPAYTELQTAVNALESRAEEFTQNPDLNSLDALHEAWGAAYSSWQYANAYNFGPAGEDGIRRSLLEEVGTFPVSVEKIETAIIGSPNFNDFNRDARGFLAVEYLIFGTENTDEAVVETFSSQNRKDYLLGAVSDINRRIGEVLSAWNGGYTSEFIQNDGTDVGSSTSMLYNEFVKSFESAKNFKLGLPLGRRPGQTQAEPQLVEAYYSGKSTEMLGLHLTAIENSWHGRSRQGQNGLGFREYLESVEGGQALIEATEAQMAEVKAALEDLPETPPLAELIQISPAPADRLHTELQKQTRFFKSDMSSLLGISITFSSGDGD